MLKRKGGSADAARSDAMTTQADSLFLSQGSPGGIAGSSSLHFPVAAGVGF